MEVSVPIRVLIADDHPVVRRGLRTFLELDSELNIVGEAEDGAAALHMAKEFRPDVVIMDLRMPAMDGLAATVAIRRELPDTEVLALTNILDEGMATHAIQAGAIGYILKDIDAPKLRQAIKAAAAGEVQLSPAVAAMLMDKIKSPGNPDALTERETEVLRQVARGRSNRQIADTLFISETTVKTHVKNIMQKLRVASRTQAVLYAAQIGLVALSLMDNV